MKKSAVVSDVTGAEIEDYVEIQVKREGHVVKRGNIFFGGSVMLHCEPGKEDQAVRSIQWVKSPTPPAVVVGNLELGVGNG